VHSFAALLVGQQGQAFKRFSSQRRARSAHTNREFITFITPQSKGKDFAGGTLFIQLTHTLGTDRS